MRDAYGYACIKHVYTVVFYQSRLLEQFQEESLRK